MVVELFTDANQDVVYDSVIYNYSLYFIAIHCQRPNE